MSEHPPYHHFKNLYCQVQNFLSLGMLLEFWEQIVGAAVKWLPREMHNPLQNGCYRASHNERFQAKWPSMMKAAVSKLFLPADRNKCLWNL